MRSRNETTVRLGLPQKYSLALVRMTCESVARKNEVWTIQGSGMRSYFRLGRIIADWVEMALKFLLHKENPLQEIEVSCSGSLYGDVAVKT
jgi:hypothetical protein